MAKASFKLSQYGQTKSESSAKGVSRMWGLDLDSWNNLIVGFLALGAVAAIVVGISTYAAFQLQKQEALSASDALERYKLEARQKIAEAVAQSDIAKRDALEAQLALEKFKAPRILLPEAQARIAAAVSPFAKTDFDVAVGPMGDPEPEILATAIASALINAGWSQIVWKTSDAQLILEKPGKPTFGFAAVTNVIIDIHSTQASRLWPIAEALAAALTADGIASDAQQGAGGRNNTNENAIHIMVGRKM